MWPIPSDIMTGGHFSYFWTVLVVRKITSTEFN